MPKVTSFRELLLPFAEADFREFTKRTIPCGREIIGVRIPQIRKIAKSIPREDFETFFSSETNSLEEVLARGFLIARLPYDKMQEYFDSQVKLMDNWCTVDTFCAALRKTVRGHEADFYKLKVSPLLRSDQEYTARTGVVCLLDFYVNIEYLTKVYEAILQLGRRQEYYVKMALAWLIAECFTKFPDESLQFLTTNREHIEPWTFNKAISKIHDSYRISDEMKHEAKKLRY
jgi:3-methyladenine DNA glycosylase AlkD